LHFLHDQHKPLNDLNLGGKGKMTSIPARQSNTVSTIETVLTISSSIKQIFLDICQIFTSAPV